MIRGEGVGTQGLSEEVSLSRYLTEEGAARQSLGDRAFQAEGRQMQRKCAWPVGGTVRKPQWLRQSELRERMLRWPGAGHVGSWGMDTDFGFGISF